MNNIINLFRKYGDREYIGEGISQISHMVQAAMLAEEESGDPELILAALLHDIGHLLHFESGEDVDQMDGYGVVDHENLGANYLRELGFSDRICRLVANHVLAKRYLCSIDPTYYNQLSHASQETFKRQGGEMSDTEIEEYESDPLYNEYCQMRLWDDRAKLTNIKIKPIEQYSPLIIEHLHLRKLDKDQ